MQKITPYEIFCIFCFSKLLADRASFKSQAHVYSKPVFERKSMNVILPCHSGLTRHWTSKNHVWCNYRVHLIKKEVFFNRTDHVVCLNKLVFFQTPFLKSPLIFILLYVGFHFLTGHRNIFPSLTVRWSLRENETESNLWGGIFICYPPSCVTLIWPFSCLVKGIIQYATRRAAGFPGFLQFSLMMLHHLCPFESVSSFH